MNRKEIIAAAIKAGMKKTAKGWTAWTIDLEHFATLVLLHKATKESKLVSELKNEFTN